MKTLTCIKQLEYLYVSYHPSFKGQRATIKAAIKLLKKGK